MARVQYRKGRERLYTNALIAGGVCMDSNALERLVGRGVLKAHLLGNLEAVDKRAQTALTVGMREEVKGLETLIHVSKLPRLLTDSGH